MHTNIIVAGLVLAGLASSPAWAGDVEVQPDGTVSWQAGVDGVGLDSNADGSFKRLYSRSEHPVNFPDRAGIAKAQVIAEEEAKGHIVSFIKQQVATGTMTSQIDTDMSKSAREIKDGKESISKDTTRTIIENVTKISGSASQGSLSGVITLERGYDDKKEVAWTVVGISQKSINVAHGLSAALNPPAAGDNKPGATSADASVVAAGNGSFPRQESEIRRSKSDW